MKAQRIDYKRLIVIVFLIIVMIVIASLTIGKDIYENREQSILSFAIVNFFGYLFFFLLMPMELAFIYYLRTGYDPLILNLVAVATAMTSQIIDYLIGYFFSTGIIDRLIGRKRYEKAEDTNYHSCIQRKQRWPIPYGFFLCQKSPWINEPIYHSKPANRS